MTCSFTLNGDVFGSTITAAPINNVIIIKEKTSFSYTLIKNPKATDVAMKLNAKACFLTLATLKINANVIGIKVIGTSVPPIGNRISIPVKSIGGMPKNGTKRANKVITPIVNTTGLKMFCPLCFTKNLET